jgi:hypothetical protein
LAGAPPDQTPQSSRQLRWSYYYKIKLKELKGIILRN